MRRAGAWGEAGWCRACRRHIPQGPDACLGVLPGISAACCGHGRPEDAYLIVDGDVLRGAAAVAYFREHAPDYPAPAWAKR